MNHFINPNKIIEAYISKPNENCGENWDMSRTHGWEIVLITGYDESGIPHSVVVVEESEINCIKKLKDLGLVAIG